MMFGKKAKSHEQQSAAINTVQSAAAPKTPDKQSPAKLEEQKQIDNLPLEIQIAVEDVEDNNGGNPQTTAQEQAEGCIRVNEIEVSEFDEELIKKAIMQKPRSQSFVIQSARQN